jgi:hypothetical protein
MFEIGSNNLTTAGTVIDRKVDHPAVCRLTLERGHQYHLLCHQVPPVKLSDHMVGCFGDSVNRRQHEQRPAGAEGNSFNPFVGKRGKLESAMKRWPFDGLESRLLKCH